jgi:beta-carotene hydroxylase
MLKYKADIRSLAYMAVTTALFVWQWQNGFNIWAYIVYLHLAVAVSVMTHNHNHINMWESKPLNLLTDWWLTVFYGIPIFCWIPTHNRNHHRYNNKEQDYTATYRNSEENDFTTLVSYPSFSSYYQIKEGIIPHMKMLYKTDRKTYWEYMFQLFVLIVWITIFMILDWKKALLFVIIPQQVSGYFVMIFNYVQHVHADEESKWNHSRNFMGVNLFLFNNGYHTIHHEKANIHWSETPKYHKEIENKIDPVLIEKSFWGYIFRVYVLGAFNSKLKTNSMRLERLKQKELVA